MRTKKAPSVFILLIITAVCTLVASLLFVVITHSGTGAAQTRLVTIVQDVLMFIAPAVAFAALGGRKPMSFLRLNKFPSLLSLLLAILTLLAGMPLMEAITTWNNSLTLPESMASIEEAMRAAEEQAETAVVALMGEHTVGNLILAILVIAILAGISEEIWFRGAFQQSVFKRHPHLAIWTTAVVFSAIHLQFFGFFPRLLLGGLLGYLFLWTGSLWTPIIVHSLNNSIVVFLLWSNHTESVFSSNATEYPPVLYIICSAIAIIVIPYFLIKVSKKNKADLLTASPKEENS